MKPLKRVLLYTLLLSLVAISLTLYVQLTGQNTLSESCSYLDPAIIDILAFIVGLFLIIEGLARVVEHPKASLKRQSSRLVRIAIGFAIVTIHIIQFIHK